MHEHNLRAWGADIRFGRQSVLYTLLSREEEYVGDTMKQNTYK